MNEFFEGDTMQLKEIQGTPTFRPGKTTGYFFWQDKNSFYLQWTTTGFLHSFRGKIVSTKPIKIIELIRLESNDSVTQPDTNSIQWEAQCQKDIDGINFETEGQIKLELIIDNIKIGLNQIYCGMSKRHPPSNPFTIE